MNRLMAGASLLALIAASGTARAADAAAASDTGATVSEVIVTGTRQTGIKAADSAAPIQVVGGQALLRTGAPDLALSLTSAVPSLNILTQGGDAAAVQILAALRGLSPNDTLVLVNGKRRHPTSNLAVDGGSVFSGSATTDLAFIPTEAIDHVEVLTDGACRPVRHRRHRRRDQHHSQECNAERPGVLRRHLGGEYYNGQGATPAMSRSTTGSTSTTGAT